jgi:polar amino acid transport system substrate-binding protein
MSLKPHNRVMIAALSVATALALAGCGSSPAANSATPSSSKSAQAGSDLKPPAILKAGTLKACVSSTAPTVLLNDAGDPEGAGIDVVNEMAERVGGLKPEYSEYAVAGLIPGVQAKQCDALVASIFITPEREEVLDFVPYMKIGGAVGVSKDNPAKVTGFDESLCGKKTLINSGAVTSRKKLDALNDKCVQDGKPSIQITPTDSSETAVQQILAGQMDAFVDGTALIGYYGKLTNKKFVQVGDAFSDDKVGVGILKGNTALLDALQGAFDSIVADGTYDEILDRWGVSEESIID